VIRSPTFYTRTHGLDAENFPSTDLRSLLTPMWTEESKSQDPNFLSTRADTTLTHNDMDAMDFEKRMDDRMANQD
jgi:hypothetical protein